MDDSTNKWDFGERQLKICSSGRCRGTGHSIFQGNDMRRALEQKTKAMRWPQSYRKTFDFTGTGLFVYREYLLNSGRSFNRMAHIHRKSDIRKDKQLFDENKRESHV